MKVPSGFRFIESKQWKFDRLDSILNKLKSKRILVFGDVGIDRYTVGQVERISPEAPVPIVFVQEEKLKLGLAANVADNIQALGAVPILVGVIGKDHSGSTFKALLKETGIPSQYLVTDSQRRTILKERIVSERQQLLRVDYENGSVISAKTEGLLFKQLERAIKKCDALIIEDYAKGTLSTKLMKKFLKLARDHQKLVAVDPNSRSLSGFYQGAKIFTPNTKEAEALSGIKIKDLKTLKQAGEYLQVQTKAEHVVITRGKEGMAIISGAKSDVRLIPTYAREVYDVSGAGDTVISVLTLALSAGATIEEACVLGNLAAAVEVGKRGTATVTPQEIREAFSWVQ